MRLRFWLLSSQSQLKKNPWTIHLNTCLLWKRFVCAETLELTRGAVCTHPPKILVAFAKRTRKAKRKRNLCFLRKKSTRSAYLWHEIRIYSLSGQRERGKMRRKRWADGKKQMMPEKNNQLNEGTDSQRTFDHQLSGSHRPAAFVSLCPSMNRPRGQWLGAGETCTCKLRFPCTHPDSCSLALS